VNNQTREEETILVGYFKLKTTFEFFFTKQHQQQQQQ